MPPPEEDRQSVQKQLDVLAGRQFIQFAVAVGVRLDLRGSPRFEITADCPIKVARPDGTVWAGEPRSVEALQELLALLMGYVSTVTVEADGGLTIRFATGASILVPPDDQYEAWQVRGDNGLLVVCTPGGGLAEWSPST